MSGTKADFLTWDENGPRIVCNLTDPLDVCDEPEYCVPNTLACNNEPNRCECYSTATRTRTHLRTHTFTRAPAHVA